ncbi:MAG: hypothetical protein WCF18_01660 [Chthoniobacteraceae bacterium]
MPLKSIPNPPPIWRPTPEAPVHIYYCKANRKTGLTVRVLAREKVSLGGKVQMGSYNLKGVRMRYATAEMIDDADVPKTATRSGVRCVLKVTAGVIEAILT